MTGAPAHLGSTKRLSFSGPRTGHVRSTLGAVGVKSSSAWYRCSGPPSLSTINTAWPRRPRRACSRSASVVIADGRALPFPDASFDLVLDRHAQVSLAEFTRVLVPGGALITQQVGGRNLQSIFDAFGWGSNAEQWGEVWSRTQRLEALVSTAPDVGLEVLRADDYEVEYAMTDLDSLVFTLKHVPFPQPFDPDAHVEAVNRLLRDSTGPHGVMSSEHRQLFVARKGQVAKGANALE